jgi:hypothetical protein
MSVGGIGATWHKLSLVQSVKAPDGSLSNIKLGSVTLSPEVGAKLAGSTIEFEFLSVDSSTQTPDTVSLTKILIAL